MSNERKTGEVNAKTKEKKNANAVYWCVWYLFHDSSEILQNDRENMPSFTEIFSCFVTWNNIEIAHTRAQFKLIEVHFHDNINGLIIDRKLYQFFIQLKEWLTYGHLGVIDLTYTVQKLVDSWRLTF